MANRRSFVRAPARRKTTWEGAVINLTSTTGADVAQALVTETTFENHPNPTIVRMRGHLLLSVVSGAAAPSDAIIFMGIKLTTASAFAAGVASLEAPFPDIGSDWIWWDVRSMRTRVAVVATDSGSTSLDTRVNLDSKAMRKVEPNKLLMLMVTNLVVTSTMSVEVRGGVRILLKQ